MKKSTITDVARESGVSVSTVSRVLNGHNNVDKELMHRVMDTIERLEYVPNASARNVRAGRSDTIGIIIPTFQTALFSEMLEGAMDAAFDQGYKLLAYQSKGKEERDIACLNSVASSSCCGLIYCPTSTTSSSHLKTVLSQDIPVVITARRGVVEGLPHVYMDNIKGCYTATKYLLQHGHRKIAFFAGFWEQFASIEAILEMMDSPQRGAYSSLDRLAGYYMAHEEFGLVPDQNLLTMSGYDYESGYNHMKEFLALLVEFDAVICANDWVASGVLQALSEQNISVPEQVSIIGYDDGIVAQIARPMLTSVRQSSYAIGQYAVGIILDQLAGKEVGDIRLDTAFMVRGSTALKNAGNQRSNTMFPPASPSIR